MKIRTILLSLVLLSLLAVTLPGAALAQEPPPDRNVLPISPEFPLAYGNEAAAAYGGGWYAVANSEDGKLKVSFFNDHNLIYNFTIKDQDAYNPDIAYEAGTGLFILVWEFDFYGTGVDYDIRGVALDPERGSDPVVETEQILAGSGNDEIYPSVDCDPSTNSCLVAWDYTNYVDTWRIEGRFCDVDSTDGLTNSGSAFHISTWNNSSDPDVAFGISSYLVIYTWDDGAIFWPAYSHVHITYQPVGNQYMHSTEFLIQPGELINADHIYAETVAYDPCAGVFVATMEYVGPSDTDILGRAVHATNAKVWDHFWITTSTNNEISPSISFVESHDQWGTPPKGSKLVLAYTNEGGSKDYGGIYATDLLSNCFSTFPHYRVQNDWRHTLIDVPDPSFGSAVVQPAVTGGGGFQQFLVAWVSYNGNDGKSQTMGRLMDAAEKSYLPLVVK